MNSEIYKNIIEKVGEDIAPIIFDYYDNIGIESTLKCRNKKCPKDCNVFIGHIAISLC